MTCNCNPAQNAVCVSNGPNDSYTIAQPACVILPDMTTQPNPFMDTRDNVSYWAYNLILGCDRTSDYPESIFIPIYENLEVRSIQLSERILSCGEFMDVPFDFQPPIGINPPPGFKFLRILVDKRYVPASSVSYVMAVAGDFPQSSGTFYIQLISSITLEYDGAFAVPGEPLLPNLGVAKTSQLVIANNQAVIDYTVTVTNTGNVDLTDVALVDTINFNGTDVSPGSVVISPEFNVDTSVEGSIRITGSAGNLNMGNSFILNYQVPLLAFRIASDFIFNSATTATSGEVVSSVNSSENVEVISLSTSSTCNILSSSSAEFQISITNIPGSPEANVDIIDEITVPPDITLQFSTFSGCTAVFSDNLEPVILNTDITGRQIMVTCPATIPINSTMNYLFRFNIVSSTSFTFPPEDVTNVLMNVTLQSEDQQILLSVEPLPDVTLIEVGGEPLCNNECTPPENLFI